MLSTVITTVSITILFTMCLIGIVKDIKSAIKQLKDHNQNFK